MNVFADYARGRNHVGNILSDAIGDVGDAVSSVTGDIGDAISSIPVVGGALASLGGDFRDFANTSFGHGFLVAITTYVTGGLQSELIPLIGPIGAQVGTVAFALPGVAAGQTFGQAWTSEFVSRSEQLAATVGTQVAGEYIQQYGKQLADQFTQLAAQAGQSVKAYAAQLQSAGVAEIQQLAAQLGVRADVLQSLIDYASGKLNMVTQAFESLPDALKNTIAAQYSNSIAGNSGITFLATTDTIAAYYNKMRAFDPTTGNITMTQTVEHTAGIHLQALPLVPLSSISVDAGVSMQHVLPVLAKVQPAIVAHQVAATSALPTSPAVKVAAYGGLAAVALLVGRFLL